MATYSWQDALRWGIQTLTQRGIPEAELEAELLLRHALGGISKEVFYTHWDKLVLSSALRCFQTLIEKRGRQKIPSAYLVGTKEFYGLSFAVSRHVFIPRPLTESLVDEALHAYSAWQERKSGGRPSAVGRQPSTDRLPSVPCSPLVEGRRSAVGGVSAPGHPFSFLLSPSSFLLSCSSPAPFSFLDIGTGSGNIAISLLKQLPDALAIATDVSKKALTVASHNARLHGVHSRVLFLHGSLFKPLAATSSVMASEAKPSPILEQNGFPSRGSPSLRLRRIFDPPAWRLPPPQEGEGGTGKPNAFGYIKLDLIISNPPYIPPSASRTLQPEIRRHEPPRALYASEGGLFHLKEIIRHAPLFLKPGGWLLLETGINQRRRLSAFLKDLSWIENFEFLKTSPDPGRLLKIISLRCCKP